MKNFAWSFLFALTGCCADTPAQTVKTKDMKTQVAGKPMTCKLTSPELRERKEKVIAKLKEQVLEKKELPDGFAYRFDGSDEMVDSLIAFIKSERMCCDFFNFKLLVSNDSAVWLEISGGEGAKAFIKTELEM